MDENQPVSATTHPITGITNIRELVARSMKATRVGSGKEGVVYEFDEEACAAHPILKHFLIKRYRLLCDVPLVGEDMFQKNLGKSTDLLELPDPFDGRNFGQPVLKDDKGYFSILVKQEGVSLNKWIRDTVCGGDTKMGATERYDSYLEWLREIPDDAILDLADKVAFLKSRGYALDATQKGNVLWDDEKKQFNIIDVVAEVVDQNAEMADPIRRAEVMRRPFQIACSSAFGIHEADVNDSVLALLKDVTKHVTMNFDISPKDDSISKSGVMALETLLEERVAKLNLNERFEHKYAPVSREHVPADALPRYTLDASVATLAGSLGAIRSQGSGVAPA